MKVLLDIKTCYGKIYTREIQVNDQKHLENYLAKANRDHSYSKIIGIHYDDSVIKGK